MNDIRSTTYTSAGGIAITRTDRVEPREDAIAGLAGALDERLGVLLTSSFEYPGRYTRWDMGFCDPALSFTGRQRGFEVRACNERGAVLIPAVAAALGDCDAVEALEADAHAVAGTVRISDEWFPEELRSKQPTLFSVVRTLIDLFRSPDDAHLGFYGAFGYELAFQFDPIRLSMPRDESDRNLVLFLPDDILVVDHRRQVATRYRYEFEVGGRAYPRSRACRQPDSVRRRPRGRARVRPRSGRVRGDGARRDRGVPPRRPVRGGARAGVLRALRRAALGAVPAPQGAQSGPLRRAHESRGAGVPGRGVARDVRAGRGPAHRDLPDLGHHRARRERDRRRAPDPRAAELREGGVRAHDVHRRRSQRQVAGLRSRERAGHRAASDRDVLAPDPHRRPTSRGGCAKVTTHWTVSSPTPGRSP